MRYLTSVLMGIVGAGMLIILAPIFAIGTLIVGFLGLIKVNEGN